MKTEITPAQIEAALVRLSDRRVVTFVRGDLPAGYAPPDGHELIDPSALPTGWQRVEEAAPEPLRQATDIALQRLTYAERVALFTARRVSADVDYFLTRAASTGIISEADADFAAGTQALAAAGIVALDRWPALLAP